ncbi:MAG: hypothetical protein WCF94_04315 [bacterium]
MFGVQAVSATSVICSGFGNSALCSDGTIIDMIGTSHTQTSYQTNNNSAVNQIMAFGEKQRQENKQEEASLKSTYGVTNFSICHGSISDCDSNKTDLTNPANAGTCLAEVSLCLEKKQMAKEVSCSYGYVKKNGQCVTYDQSCNMSYENSFFLKIDSSDNSRVCDCKDGYEWNSTKTGCVVSPTKDQKCQTNIGENTVWSGKYNESGGLICDCKIGYSWKSDNKGCELPPIKTNDQNCKENFLNSFYNEQTNTCDCPTGYDYNDKIKSCITKPVKTNDQLCTDTYGINSFYLETNKTNNKIICDCKQDFQWNIDNTRCILANTIKTNNQICDERYGNSYWSGKMDEKGKPTCGCNNGYWRNNEQTKCIPVPKDELKTSPVSKKIDKSANILNTETNKISTTAVKSTSTVTLKIIKPTKGIWSKIISWFGF